MSIPPTATVSMREFLRSGEFGPLRLGDSVASLQEFFGEPSDTGGTSRRHRIPGIWKYGDVEFHLTSDRTRVRLIFCDNFEQLRLGPVASFAPWFFTGHPPFELVERELTAASIGFQRHDWPLPDSSQFLLRLDNGVNLMFNPSNHPMEWPGTPGLFGFTYADKNLEDK